MPERETARTPPARDIGRRTTAPAVATRMGPVSLPGFLLAAILYVTVTRCSTHRHLPLGWM